MSNLTLGMRIFGVVSILSSTSLSPTVLAQDSEIDNQSVLDEVIVTARKREESLQDSPVAISAFSAETLRDSGVATMRDLSTAVPGLAISEAGSKSTAIFIRGIGQKESSNAALDPSVGVYINGLFIARSDTQLLDTVDTESVQVLRGPQGTLFGKNTTAGAMLVTTKSPSVDGFSGTAATKIGNYGRRDAKLFVNIPLNEDTLAMRFAVNSVKRDGYLENVNNGRDFGDEDRLASAVRLLWEPSDSFSADLFRYLSKQNENGGAFTCLAGNPNSRIASQISFPGSTGTTNLSHYSDSCRQSEELAKDNKVALNSSEFQLTNHMIGLTLLWDLDEFEIKSITGYSFQNDILIEDDQDGAGIPALQNGGVTFQRYLNGSGFPVDDEKRSQLSQEFNLIGSAFDESLSYTIGVFYSQEAMDNSPFTQEVGPGGFSMVNQFGNSGFSTQKFLGTVSDLDTETSAVFAQSTYDVADWFQLTLGARYTAETRKRKLSVYTVNFAQLASAVGGSVLPGIEGVNYGSIENFNFYANEYAQGRLQIPLNASPIVNDDKKTWGKFTPAVTLTFPNLQNYLPFDNLDTGLLYFTYSKGFKAGGFEPRGTELRAFDPEEVSNYELGAKFEMFDHRLRLNTAAYYMDYSDLQVRVAETGPQVTDLYLYLSNAGEATIKGYEFELSAIPVDDLTISMTFNYTDASYDKFTSNEVFADPGQAIPTDHVVNRKNEPYGFVAKKSGALSVNYVFKTEDAGMFIPRMTAYYRDKTYIGLDYKGPEYESSWIDSYTVLSARLTWIANDQWNIAAFVDNLADKDYFQGGFSLQDALGAANVVKAPPRTYGLELFYDF